MAATHRTTDNKATTYTLVVTFTVHLESNQDLRDRQGICDEAQSWLESVGATVHSTDVQKADPT
jgi:hypothetical protein